MLDAPPFLVELLLLTAALLGVAAAVLVFATVRWLLWASVRKYVRREISDAFRRLVADGTFVRIKRQPNGRFR